MTASASSTLTAAMMPSSTFVVARLTMDGACAYRSVLGAQDPVNPRTRVTLNSIGSALPVPIELAPSCAMAVFVGSIAPACAARFGDGTRPPTIRTFRQTYAFTFAPVRWYLAPVFVSDSVNRWGSVG